ncbi:unnamed protein product [Paramecium primaurelia]|uniref:Uncharacterized protein n=1 Tax=Paramecium primaurelia TaxID=5886 RepID=A0A8S1MGE7_PARPR|nr:unnamed protein product [Paramecium primaurelia]
MPFIQLKSTMTNLDFLLIKPNTGEKYYYPVCNFIKIGFQQIVQKNSSISKMLQMDSILRIILINVLIAQKFMKRFQILYHMISIQELRMTSILLQIKFLFYMEFYKVTLKEIKEDLGTHQHLIKFNNKQNCYQQRIMKINLKKHNNFLIQPSLIKNLNQIINFNSGLYVDLIMQIQTFQQDIRIANMLKLMNYVTRLIGYQIENYRDLQNKQLQEKESNSQSFQQILIYIQNVLKQVVHCLVVDFELLKAITRSYPGNQLFVVSKLNNDEITLSDYISNNVSNKDQFISTYWNNNKLDKLFQLSFQEFQRIVLEKMVTVINLELHRNVKEKINQCKHSNCLMKLKDQSGQMIELPARCVNCPIPKENESYYSETKISLLNWDIRTFVTFIVHKQNKKETSENYNALYVKLNLEGIQFKFNLTINQFFMMLSYIRKCRLTQKKLVIGQIICSHIREKNTYQKISRIYGNIPVKIFKVIKKIVKFKRYIMNQFIVQILKIY